MDNSTGKLIAVFIVAAAMSVLGSWLLAWRFRTAMRVLMSRPVGAPPAPAPEAPIPSTLILPPPVWLSADDNRRASWRLAVLLVGLSCLIALSSAALSLGLMAENLLTPARTLTWAFVFLWPVLPVLGVAWRWSRLRVLGALLLWCVLAYPVLNWRSVEAPTAADLVTFLALQVGPTLVLVVLLCMGNATRAIATWLLPPLLVMVLAAFAGLDVLTVVAQQPPAWASSLAAWIDTFASARLTDALVVVTLLLFILLPIAIVWWPLKWFARGLALLYSRQWISELMVLFTAVWGVFALDKAIDFGNTLGLRGAAMLLPLLWIPLLMMVVRRRRPLGRPPTLLVLRVFQRDRAMRRLFDEVVERWRLSGNTVMIAGTDLVDRTLDAGDIFDFLDRRLAERFIMSADQIPARLASLELEPDAEGRYRVNECYCHDSTWRETLAALLARSDLVLMDLRGFQRRNEGCGFELAALARAPHLARVLLLTDGHTDRAAADQAVAAAPSGRFMWLDATRVTRVKRREVLTALFAPPSL